MTKQPGAVMTWDEAFDTPVIKPEPTSQYGMAVPFSGYIMSRFRTAVNTSIGGKVAIRELNRLNTSQVIPNLIH